MRSLNLPIWLNRGTSKKLAEFLHSWWLQLETWIQTPLSQLDPDTCTLGILTVIAWGRNVTRFSGEPEDLYRLRVKHAFINAVDAGSVAGIKRIFVRLGIGDIEVLERQPNRDWDIISLELSDQQLSENQTLLSLLLQKYGRTCRRYQISTTSQAPILVMAASYSHTSKTVKATL